MKPLIRILAAVSILILTATAQTPYSLKHSIPPPPPGLQSYGHLGRAVAVNAQFTVAGAPNDATGGQHSGVVKVFSSTTGALLFVLVNPNPANERFGEELAMSGNRLVVGSSNVSTGAALVYELDSATPTAPVFTINSPAGNPLADFGGRVAIDGTRIVVVGSDESTGHPGSVYVFEVGNATPIFTVHNPSADIRDQFGSSVAISGNRLVVGSAPDGGDFGRAFVYNIASTTPTVPVVTIVDPTPAREDSFGAAVGILGDRVVVGDPLDVSSGSGQGTAYVYDLSSATPAVAVTTLHNPSGGETGFFGFRLAMSGERVIFGALHAAYVYDLSSATPMVPVSTIQNPTPDSSDVFADGFGEAVAISGTHVAVGAWADAAAGTYAGSVHKYDLSSATPTVPVFTMNDAGRLASAAHFGGAVAVEGRYIVVGAPEQSTGVLQSGSVYVFDLASATPLVPLYELVSPSPDPADGFGNAVAISGSRVAVGAFRDTALNPESGTVFIYDLSSATPTKHVAFLYRPGSPAGDAFGYSVAISGTRVLVGAPAVDTPGAGSSGAAFFFDLASATPEVPLVTLNNPEPSEDDVFGTSVAISGGRALIGTPQDTVGGIAGRGRVFIYNVDGPTPTTPALSLDGPVVAGTFGSALAVSGSRVVVNSVNNGLVFVFDLDGATPTIPIASLSDTEGPTSGTFGYAVSIAGTRVAVGSHGQAQTGAVHVFDMASATPAVPVQIIHNPPAALYDSFGFSVAMDGANLVVGAPWSDLGGLDKGAAYVFERDTIALPPTLISPVADSLNGANFQVAYTLPEDASEVWLDVFEFDLDYTQSLSVMPTERGVGAHAFDFTPRNPGGSGFDGGSPLPDGTYSFTLRYQDLAGNWATAPATAGVVIDATPPTMGNVTLEPEGTIYAGDPITLTLTGWTDAHGPLEYAFPTSNGQYGPWQSSNVSPPITLSAGFRQLIGQVRDALGNQQYFFHALTVEPPVGPQIKFATGGAVPGAGSDLRIPAGAVWASFGSPAIAGEMIAFLGKWKSPSGSGTGIFLDGQLIAKVGEAVPRIAGATWRSFKDPVWNGSVAFIGTIQGVGVTSANDSVVAAAMDALKVIAREGSVAEGSGGATFRDFSSVGVNHYNESFATIEATLLAGSGSPAVTAASDRGVWRYRDGIGMEKLFREGDSGLPGMVAGETLKSFLFYSLVPGSPGQGRATQSAYHDSFQWTLSSGRQLAFGANPFGTTRLLAATGDSLNSAALPGAVWKKVSQIATAEGAVTLGELQAGVGGTTAANAKGIFYYAYDEQRWEPVARMGDAAPGMGNGAIFKAFKDPVNHVHSAFMATAAGGSVSSADNDGIWMGSYYGNVVTLLAREGAQPPGAPAGAQWKSFTSLAYAGGLSDTSYITPLFTATLRIGPGGITSAIDVALYDVGDDGAVKELLREGQLIGAKTVRSFDVLKTTSGSTGVTRSFNQVDLVVARIVFTDNSNALVTIPLH